MLNKIYMAKSMHLICGIILDGTYPLQDGDALHLFPVNTCAYIFIEDDDRMKECLINDLELYP